jgi:hypothetical protein
LLAEFRLQLTAHPNQLSTTPPDCHFSTGWLRQLSAEREAWLG